MPTTTNFGWTTPADTDLVKDGAAAIRTLAGNIDTSLVDLKGGTTGQVLAKNSNTDLDYIWVAQDDSNAIQNAIIDAKGDLIVGTAADTPARLAVGVTNGHVLTVDSTEASGMKWAAGAAGMTLLSTTTLSSTTTTISSIPGGYVDLAIYGVGTTWSTGSNRLSIRPNGVQNSGSYNVIRNSPSIDRMEEIVGGGSNYASSSNYGWFVLIKNYTDTNAYKPLSWYGASGADLTLSTMNAAGAIATTSAITSISITTSGGTATLGGTVLIYGVK